MSASYSQLINKKKKNSNKMCVSVCRGGGEGRLSNKAIIAKILTVFNI